MSALQHWVTQQVFSSNFSLHPLKGDASFRRYYRVKSKNNTYIAVDSPPQTEDNAGFVKMSGAFLKLDLCVPEVIAYDLERGFLLLTDLGDQVLFNYLLNINNNNFINYKLYYAALSELAKIQQCKISLASFDEVFMRRELDFFVEWFLKQHLGYDLSRNTQKMLDKIFALLIQSAVTQPQCCIHRDYHSRNLMIIPDNINHSNNLKIGILDFQDAMIGPVTYDLVSLVRDCYIHWPAGEVKKWALDFHREYLINAIPGQEEFMRYFDWMGIQRHLKAIFIFSRKYHRDHVNTYLKDIPRVLNYITSVSKNYIILNDFYNFILECSANLPGAAAHD